MVAFDLWDHLGRRVTPMLAVYATATVVVTSQPAPGAPGMG